ncbi:MAG: type II toxin-antitoxin system RelB/DinJ family antitoxin [Candidatus Uhrbacteria bacterium]
MTTVINFKTDKQIKTQAQKIASQMGLNLSDVLNVYLRNFINNKILYISLDKSEQTPTSELLAAIKSARKEYARQKNKPSKNSWGKQT